MSDDLGNTTGKTSGNTSDTSGSSSDDVVLCSIDGGVATLTLNRPGSNNGWTGDMQTLYFEYLRQCEADASVRAIVVTGAGRSFCPGADMQGLAAASRAGGLGGSLSASPTSPSNSPTTPTEPLPGYYPMTISKPIIGAINGACAGVGLVQALMFDVRIAAAGAKFTVAFARRGLVAEYGSAWLLPRIVGHSNAMDLLLSSRVVVAEEALAMGLVNRVVEPGEVLSASLAYAHDLAQNCCPTSMSIMKRQVRDDYLRSLADAVADADVEMRASLKRADFKEGVASFLERRPPAFAPVGS